MKGLIFFFCFLAIMIHAMLVGLGISVIGSGVNFDSPFLTDYVSMNEKVIKIVIDSGLIKLIGVFIVINIAAVLISAVFSLSGALAIEVLSPKNWATKFLENLSDALTRIPAVLCGVFAYILLTGMGLRWNLGTQVLILCSMMLPSVLNSYIAVLRSYSFDEFKNSNFKQLRKEILSPSFKNIIYGAGIAVYRVWIEIVITVYFLIIVLQIQPELLLGAQSFGGFFGSVINQSADPSALIGKITALITLVAIINSYINWNYKNFAVKMFKMKK